MISAAGHQRLRRLRADPLFGPMFDKLTRPQKDQVADLVYKNNTRQARNLLTRYDERRRERARTLARVRRYLKRPARLREGDYRPDEEAAFWRLYDRLADL